MIATIKTIIFSTLLFTLMSAFLPVVEELPFGIDDSLVQGVGMIRELFNCMPFLEFPYELFLWSMFLLFIWFSFELLMFFITRGKSKAP